MDVGYRLNIYDHDGDINEEGVFIYFNEINIIKFNNILELEKAIETMQRCVIEAKEQIQYI